MRHSTATRDDESVAVPAPGQTSVATRSLPRALLQTMRPREWIKNLLLFVGVIFAGHLLMPSALMRATVAAIAFCAASSAVYLFNDLRDIERDRHHPVKQRRPLAAGELAPAVAMVSSLVLAALALASALVLRALPLAGTPRVVAVQWQVPFISFPATLHPVAAQGDPYAALGGNALLFAVTVLAYLALQVAYTLRLKDMVLLDVFAIAAGFVLRALAGAVAVAVPISPWLYLCTILLSLLLALSKRRQEALTLADGGVAHRQILQEYPLPLLDQFITVVTSATIMAYSLYTFQSETAGDHRLMLTIPLVIYGIFRYLYLVQVRHLGGNPAEVLWRDRHMQGAVIGWVIIAGLVLYVLPR